MEFFELLYYSLSFYDIFSPANNSDPFTVLWVSMIVAGVLFVAVYVLQAIALWTISGREGYKHRWMAFIPFLNTYYIGVLSDKNRFYNMSSKALSLALAIVELLLVAGYIVYYAVAGIIYAGGLYEIQTQTVTIMGQTQTIAVGYISSSRIAGTWFAWVFDYLEGYVLVWINLAYILLNVFVVISFFQTYACRRYVLMSFASVLFPVKGVLMFAVRNNKGMNYRDYVRGEQRRRYEMYQQYTSQNGGNPYGGYNPYGSRPGTPSGDPYQSPRSGDSAPDPFDGLGSSGNSQGTASSSDDDPFDEFKK